ncbi:MAG TPA: bacillithiol biosynthesis deacetylase BshB1 [Balneola sp.]|nr:bacillithiol biosynthesis deacetylase BshB1 [Balneola sp.]
MKLDVLVFAAHPDDAELNIGGTICALIKQNLKVGVIDLTKGEMGTRGTVETRKKEAHNASVALGLHYRKNLDLGDSKLDNTRANQLKIITEVRNSQPDVCTTGAPHDRHPDHGKATQLVLDSLFYSGLQKIDSGGQQPWRPEHILHYMQDRPFEPDFVFDISETWEQKKKSLLAFETQFNVSEAGEEPETYISTPSYFKQLESRARYFGHLAGFEFGEPLKYHNGPAPLSSFDEFFSNKANS